MIYLWDITKFDPHLVNTVTPLMGPNVHGPMVTALMGSLYFWNYNVNNISSNLLHVKRLACKIVSHPLCSSPLEPSFLADGEKRKIIIFG